LSNPQIEDGYTRIANEIMENVYAWDFNGTQLKIILCLWRYTYGFQRKEHCLSESFLAKAVGRHRKQVGQELTRLIDMGVIKVISPATFSEPRVISFNKRFEEWGQKEGQGVNSLPPIENTSTTGSESTTTPGSKFTTSTGSKFTPQEKKEKENNKKNNKEKNNASQKHKYGEYNHVLLTDQEKNNLIAEYGQVFFEACIKKLDEYIELHGAKYKNHNLAIRKWVIKSVGEDGIKKEPQQQTEPDMAEKESDRFRNLSPEIVEEYRALGIITEDDGLDLYDATGEQIKLLQEAGAL